MTEWKAVELTWFWLDYVNIYFTPSERTTQISACSPELILTISAFWEKHKYLYSFASPTLSLPNLFLSLLLFVLYIVAHHSESQCSKMIKKISVLFILGRGGILVIAVLWGTYKNILK